MSRTPATQSLEANLSTISWLCSFVCTILMLFSADRGQPNALLIVLHVLVCRQQSNAAFLRECGDGKRESIYCAWWALRLRVWTTRKTVYILRRRSSSTTRVTLNPSAFAHSLASPLCSRLASLRIRRPRVPATPPFSTLLEDNGGRRPGPEIGTCKD